MRLGCFTSEGAMQADRNKPDRSSHLKEAFLSAVKKK